MAATRPSWAYAVITITITSTITIAITIAVGITIFTLHSPNGERGGWGAAVDLFTIRELTTSSTDLVSHDNKRLSRTHCNPHSPPWCRIRRIRFHVKNSLFGFTRNNNQTILKPNTKQLNAFAKQQPNHPKTKHQTTNFLHVMVRYFDVLISINRSTHGMSCVKRKT